MHIYMHLVDELINASQVSICRVIVLRKLIPKLRVLERVSINLLDVNVIFYGSIL